MRPVQINKYMNVSQTNSIQFENNKIADTDIDVNTMMKTIWRKSDELAPASNNASSNTSRDRYNEHMDNNSSILLCSEGVELEKPFELSRHKL